MNASEDDVIEIGKLRRPGLPGASIIYDPRYGIRVASEDCPPAPAAAAAWCRTSGGWVRLRAAARKSDCDVIKAFVYAWRKCD
jgi:hypothetical protein